MKKAVFLVTKTFSPIFSRIIECDKHDGPVYKSPKEPVI